VTPSDSRRAFLLVGFAEYGNALSAFTKLLKSSTEDELAAMDEIVARRPEFTIYTDLASQVQSGPSTLGRYADSESDGKRGFAWVIALARVEFGAMMAGFTDVPSPFTVFPVHEYDAMAYRQMLLDGATNHYWALVNDPALKRVTSTSPANPIVLAYSRRLVMARAMLSATMRLSQQQLSNIQMRELSSWKESLDELQAGFVVKIQLYVQSFRQTSTKRSMEEHEYRKACDAMLRAEARELRAGTAQVIPLDR